MTSFNSSALWFWSIISTYCIIHASTTSQYFLTHCHFRFVKSSTTFNCEEFNNIQLWKVQQHSTKLRQYNIALYSEFVRTILHMEAALAPENVSIIIAQIAIASHHIYTIQNYFLLLFANATYTAKKLVSIMRCSAFNPTITSSEITSTLIRHGQPYLPKQPLQWANLSCKRQLHFPELFREICCVLCSHILPSWQQITTNITSSPNFYTWWLHLRFFTAHILHLLNL